MLTPRKRSYYEERKKSIARFAPVFYSRSLPITPDSDGTEPAKSRNMRNSKGPRDALLILATALVCLAPHFVKGQDAVSSGSVGSKEGPIVDLGTGNFSNMPVKLSVSVQGGYDDNVNTTSVNQQGSPFTNVNAGLTYAFGSPRTQITLGAGAGFTYYWDHPQTLGGINNDYDINIYLNLAVTHKVSPRLTLSALAYISYQTEPDFSIAAGLNHRAGNYFYTNDKFTAAYLWTPRFSTATSYTFGALNYDDQAAGFFQDRIENTIGNEFRFLLWPTTTLVAEYRIQWVNYEYVPNNSVTNYILGGFDHNFSPRLTASFRGGAQFRDNETGGDETSPYFEGTVNYAVGKQTAISWNANYGIQEPDQNFSQSMQTFRTGLTATHNFTPRITGTLGVYYEHDDFQNSFVPGAVTNGSTQEDIDLAITLRYAITRYLGIQVGYNYTDLWSDIPLQGYTRNRFWGGLNFIF